MTELDAPRLAALTWSVSLRPRRDRDVERDVAALVAAVGQALADHFEDASGYETVWSRLSGPIEGATARVARGRFKAAVSVQRFARAYADGGGHGCASAVEVRLVATAEVVSPAGSVRDGAWRRATRNETTSAAACAGRGAASLAACWAIGTAALGVSALAAAGLLTVWVQALLLVPALVAWRTSLALSRAAAPAAALPDARKRPRPRDPAVRDAIVRWRRVLVRLEGHRHILEDDTSLAPFRVPPRSLGETG